MDEFEISVDADQRIELTNMLAVATRAVVTSTVGTTTVEVEVIYDGFLGRLAVSSIHLSAMPGEEVNGAVMRTIRVQDFVADAGDSMIFMKDASGKWDLLLSFDKYLYDLEDGTDRETVAAAVYTLARLKNLPPLKAVADALNVSQSTATRLVARARQAGKLD